MILYISNANSSKKLFYNIEGWFTERSYQKNVLKYG